MPTYGPTKKDMYADPKNTATVPIEAKVIGESAANPGYLYSTPTGTNNPVQVGTSPTAQTFQAYTKSATPLISNESNPNILGATDANAYIKSQEIARTQAYDKAQEEQRILEDQKKQLQDSINAQTSQDALEANYQLTKKKID